MSSTNTHVNSAKDYFSLIADNSRQLFKFIKSNNESDALKLLQESKHIDLDMKDKNGNHLIFFIISRNMVNLFKYIIEEGLSINLAVIDKEGHNVLYYPIKSHNNIMVELLIEYNINYPGLSILNIRGDFDNTPLNFAALYENVKALKLLLFNGADPDLFNKNKENCLMIAAGYGNYKMTKLIIPEIKNINAEGFDEANVLFYSISGNNTKILELLINNGANVNRTDKNGAQPIYFTINRNMFEFTKILVEAGTLTNFQSYYSNTFMHLAIEKKNIEIVDYLFSAYEIQKRPLVNIYSEHVNTPNTYKLIDPNLVNVYGETLLHTLFIFWIPEYDKYIRLLIPNTFLLQQNIHGNTVLHLMKERWKEFKEELTGPYRFLLFIQNRDGENIIDRCGKDIIDLTASNYYLYLKKYEKQWLLDWQNDCSLKNSDEKKCIEMLKEEIIKENYPLRKERIMISIENDKTITVNTFDGEYITRMAGLLYLQLRYSNDKIYKKISIVPIKYKDYIPEGIFFEIGFYYGKFIILDSLVEEIKNAIEQKNNFIVILLGIMNIHGGHANMIIFDINNKTVERFEPHGSGKDFYDSEFLDNNIKKFFLNITKDFIYLSPDNYEPRSAFQNFDTIEARTNIIYNQYPGYCMAWSIWYVDHRLKHPNMKPKILVRKLLRHIQLSRIPFIEIIRNYTSRITDIRDKYFEKFGFTHLDYMNNKISKNIEIEIVKSMSNNEIPL